MLKLAQASRGLLCLLYFVVQLSAQLTSAQTLVEKTYLLRWESTSHGTDLDLVRNCILVYPDGRYRLEHSVVHDSGRPDDQVYLDKLPEDKVKELLAILDDPKLAQMESPKGKGGIIDDIDSLFLHIPREHGLQEIGFWTTKERKAYQADLKPLQTWLKEVQKRKVPWARAEKTNNCDPPDVTYGVKEKVTLHPE